MFGRVRYLDEDEMRRWSTGGAYPMEKHMQQHVWPGEEAPLKVGDRVRLKGDDEGHWLTIKRMDELPGHPTDPNQPRGVFCTLSYWTKQPAGPQGAPVLSEMGGFRPECLTKEPPPTAKRPSWGRTVKTPAAAKKPVTRSKKR